MARTKQTYPNRPCGVIITPCTTSIKCRKCYAKILSVYYVKIKEPYNRAYHLDCYVYSRNWEYFHTPASPESFTGFQHLGENKQLKLKKLLWPNQVEPSLRPTLNLTRSINTMSLEEIRIELEKRGVKQHFTSIRWKCTNYKNENGRQEVMNRLKTYLNSNICKRMNEILVIGYCSESERKNTLNVPSYLKRIILRYYPPYFEQ